MSLVKAGKSQKKKATAESDIKRKFHHCWQQIARLEKKLAAQQEERQVLVARFEKEVRPLEEAQFESSYRKAEQLLGFYQKKSLNNWQREELRDWLESEFNFLLSHPFRTGLDPELLYQRFHEHAMSQHSDEELGSEENLEQAREMLGSMFGPDLELSDEQIIAGMRDPEIFQTLIKEHLARQQEEELAKSEDDDEDFSFFDDPVDDPIKELLNPNTDISLSGMKSLYKKLALALHPDREQDEEKKGIRAQQMSQLLTAWEQKDIYTLLNLADQHLDDQQSPLTDQNLLQLLPLLWLKRRELQNQLDDLTEGNDIGSIIYHNFKGRTKRATEQNFTTHIAELKESLRLDAKMLKEVTTLKALKPCLVARWEMRMEEEFSPFDLFDDDLFLDEDKY